MEYTKDVIFNIQYAKKKEDSRYKKWKEGIINFYSKNKFIVHILSLLLILTSIDLYMVFNFIKILTNI